MTNDKTFAEQKVSKIFLSYTTNVWLNRPLDWPEPSSGDAIDDDAGVVVFVGHIKVSSLGGVVVGPLRINKFQNERSYLLETFIREY